MEPAPHSSPPAIPSRLAQRPRDVRGYPIPATILITSSGKPDFRITDTAAWVRAVNLRTCALCGQALGRHLAFVGGPLAHKNRLFTDLPMHRDCAEYALQVCPFLAAPNFRYAESLRVDDNVAVSVSAEVSPERPDRFFLGITTKYRVVRFGESMLAQAEPWSEVVWWRLGAPVVPVAAEVAAEGRRLCANALGKLQA